MSLEATMQLLKLNQLLEAIGNAQDHVQASWERLIARFLAAGFRLVRINARSLCQVLPLV